MNNYIKVGNPINPKIIKKFIYYFNQGSKLTYCIMKQADFNTIIEEKLTTDSLNCLYNLLGYKHNKEDTDLVNNYNNILTIEKLFKFIYDLINIVYFNNQTSNIFKLLFNKWLINNNYLPVIFYPGISKKIIELVNELDFTQASSIINYLYSKSSRLNSKHSILKREYIKEVILTKKEEAFNLYNIEHVYLSGLYNQIGSKHNDNSSYLLKLFQ